MCWPPHEHLMYAQFKPSIHYNRAGFLDKISKTGQIFKIPLPLTHLLTFGFQVLGNLQISGQYSISITPENVRGYKNGTLG